MTSEARQAVNFDQESQDDDSSMSLSANNDESLLFQASTWGGAFSDERTRIRRTFSWPGGSGKIMRNGPSNTAPYESANDQPMSMVPNYESQQSPGDNVTGPNDESHGICHNFPSADENFQVAVEEMMARLSPGSSSWRRDTHVTEYENTEFLNNYFYCTKTGEVSNASGYDSFDQHICAEPCNISDSSCHNIGVDAMCSGIRFIFSDQNSQAMATKARRQRAVSLDARLANKDSRGWLSKFERLFSQFGSTFEPTSDESQESVKFDPPYLKKSPNTLGQPQ
jgi:hypothetical protein